MRKIVISLIVSLVVLLGLVAGMFFFYASPPNYVKNNISNPFPVQNITANANQNSSSPFTGENIIINETHITYLLNEMGAYNLKSYLGDTPKIEVDVDREKFNSEIKEGIIETKSGGIENADIKVALSKEELINVALADDPSLYIKDAVSSGKISVKLVASYSKLFAKGYLSLYQKITGSSISGSVIKIFSG